MQDNKIEYNKECPFLSVVIVGRNEENNLPQLFTSLPEEADVEWIYIDSCSSDKSASIAAENNAKVFQIDKTSVFAPSTGRYIGTLEASGEWILYIDGDMVLDEEFRDFLNLIRDKQVFIPADVAGFVGRTRNQHLNRHNEIVSSKDYVVLSEHEMGRVEEWGSKASYHGGAVLYRRSIVIEAGNWNPAISQLEEIELYSRIRSMGWHVRAVDILMVDHYTPYLTHLEKIKIAFMPRYGDKVLHGAGQVVMASILNGNLFSFIKSYPYPFVVFTGLVLSLPLYLIYPYFPLLVNVLIVIWISVAKKWYYYLVYLGNVFQILRGLRQYKPFNPSYKKYSA